MYIIREVYTARPGQAGKLAKMFKKMGGPQNWRVMTDVFGPYNTVVLERELKSLTEWEKEMESYRKGEPDPNMTPEMEKEMSHYHEMFFTGRREIYRIEE